MKHRTRIHIQVLLIPISLATISGTHTLSMLRYLSPAKISLVILIELYRTSEAKSSDSIVLLSFISTHILRRANDALTSDGSSQPESIGGLTDFHQLLAPLTSRFPGRSLYDVFLRSLWSQQSLENLEQLFSSVSSLSNTTSCH